MPSTNSPEAFHPSSPSGATSAAELRHMTSSGVLSPSSARSPTTNKSSNRHSQHLQAGRLGSKSPASIPSSPTSVHSSSSAIFERDIEPLTSPPLLLSPNHATGHVHPPNPHQIPRGKNTEQLEQSVPSVLDSAAAILAGMQDSDIAGEQISVEAPAAPRRDGRSSGWASPIGSFRSRSPSPFGSKSPGRTSLLLSIPGVSSHTAQQPSAMQASTNSTPIPGPAVSPPSPRSVGSGSAGSGSPPLRPTVATTNLVGASVSTGGGNTPSIVTPTSAYFSTASSADSDGEGGEDHEGDDVDEEPKTTTKEKAPALPKVSTAVPIGHSTVSPRTPIHSSHPPTFSSPSSHTSNATNATATTAGAVASHATSPISPISTTTSIPSSPTNYNASKRLSFMSYADLLSSTPTSTLPLSSLTTAASSVEPPPHIPSVNGLVVGGSSSPGSVAGGSPPPSFSSYLGGSGSHSTNGSLRNFPLSPLSLGASQSQSPSVSGQAGGVGNGGRDRDSIVFLDDLVGGEWEREGLGRGLEERLDALMPIGGKA